MTKEEEKAARLPRRPAHRQRGREHPQPQSRPADSERPVIIIRKKKKNPTKTERKETCSGRPASAQTPARRTDKARHLTRRVGKGRGEGGQPTISAETACHGSRSKPVNLRLGNPLKCMSSTDSFEQNQFKPKPEALGQCGVTRGRSTEKKEKKKV